MGRRVFLGGGVCAMLWSSTAQAQAKPFVLEARPAALSLAGPDAKPVQALAYNGAAPGPLLRVRQGAPLTLRLVNGLAAPTTLSFPGLRVGNAFAGIGGLTGAPFAPGASADIAFAPPEPGFNLYMPHSGAAASEQISRGLFGPIVVEETAPPAADLEAIVVLADWRLDADGAVAGLGDPGIERGPERRGDLVTVNSAPGPARFSAAPGARVRLRLANAATTRTMNVLVDGGRVHIVAVDGQPSEMFEPLRNLLPVSPGARFELMFDLPRTGLRLTLRGDPGDLERPAIVFDAAGEPLPARPAVVALPPNPRLPTEINLEQSRRFELILTGGGESPYAVSGVTFKDWSAKSAFTAPRGAPVTLGLANKTPYPQTMRLWGHVARLLHPLDDGWEPYWRDILVVQPGKTLHAAFIADNPGKWPIESVSPERRNAGLAAWFQVS